MSLIITPEHPDFYPILHSAPPPGWREQINSNFSGCFAVRSNSLLSQPMTQDEINEYLEDGEYDELEWLDEPDSDC